MESQSISSAPLTQFGDSLNESKGLGKDQFLTLLVAQMKHQDPLNPMEGTDFTAQLAQFSSLEQLFAVNSNLQQLQMNQAELTDLQATAYLGKNVVSPGDEVFMAQGAVSPAFYELSAEARSGNLTVYDAAGAIVRVLDLDGRQPGIYPLSWDGTDMEGNPVPDGAYSIRTDFYDDMGRYVLSGTYQAGQVTGIAFDQGQTLLIVGAQRVPVQDVIEVF